MCEVDRHNFEEKYPEIIDNLHSATFIAVDCEFSGLFDDKYKPSLFDTPEQRYKKLQSTLENYTILQLGLTTFEYDRTHNRFNSSSYNFYLLPSPFFRPQSTITCQLSSLEFLSRHQFDFNKPFRDGISYLRKGEEEEALRMIEEESLLDNIDRECLQEYLSEIAEWAGRENEGSETSLNVEKEWDVLVYVLHQEVRKRFANIWTYFDKPGSFRVQKVSNERKITLMENREEKIELKKKLLNSLLGFSRIVREIEGLKKPIVGHNFFLDLIIIYKQFYNSSPVTYKQFKRNIHRIFPNIYDTKHMSFNLLKLLPKESHWSSNSLPGLFHYLRYGRGANIVLFTPLITSKNEQFIKTGHFHDAAFDSYSTGFCFVKMAHMYSLWDDIRKVFSSASMITNSGWLLRATETMKNSLNISRGQVNHIVLNGPDPKSSRPGFLYIQSKNGEPLSIEKISEEIAKYGSIDIQLLSRRSGLMAVSNRRQVEEVLNTFRNHDKYHVTKYNFLKHSNLGKNAVAGAIIISAISFLLFSFKNQQNLTLSKIN